MNKFESFIENIVAIIAIVIFAGVVIGSIFYKTQQDKLETKAQPQSAGQTQSLELDIKQQSIQANSVSDDEIQALYEQKRQQIADKKRQEQEELESERRRIKKQKEDIAKKQKAKERQIAEKERALKKERERQKRRITEEKAKIAKEKKDHQKKLQQEREKQKEALAKEKAEFERQKKLEAKRKKEAEAKRKKEAEAKRKKEAEKKRKEAELKRKAEAKKKAEAKRKAEEKRILEEKRRAEAAKKKAEAERQALLAGLGDSLASDISEREEALKQSAIQKYGRLISDKVRSNWTKPAGLPNELSVKMSIRLDRSGNVKGIPKIIESSGYPAFDNSAVEAAKRASPLPLPEKAEWARLFTEKSLRLNFP